MISRANIDEIMSTARVDEVIGDYVNLKNRGANMLGLCPFHNEKTPSFTVSPAKNLYKCFGCGKGGGAVNFLMEHESFSYPEALRHLAKRYNIKIDEEEQTDEQREAQKVKESLLIINEMASKYFQDQLRTTEEGKAVGLSYFKHRGLLEVTIDQFDLGYCAKEYKAFGDFATQKGFKLELLQQLGLVSKNGYDFFRERVIFPFHNLSGKVIGFGGRILQENKKPPKYLNSPESHLYNKRKTLYGLYQAKGEIRKKGVCILVEGYTDVLSLHQNEIRNAVASSGTSLTPEQVRLIKRFADEVLVLYDGDAAGQKAALRGLNIFLEYDINVKLVTLPEGHDPDSYVRELGSSEFSNYLKESSKDFILYLAQNIEDNYAKDPVQKSVQIRELTESIALIVNQIKRSLYVKECANILAIEESALFQEINRVIKKKIQRNKNKYENSSKLPPPNIIDPVIESTSKQDHSQGIRVISDQVKYQERDVIRVLITDGEKIYNDETNTTIASYILSHIESIRELISDQTHIAIFDEYTTKLENSEYPSRESWTSHQNEAIRSVAINLLSSNYAYAKWSDRGLELQTQKPIEENYIKDCEQAISRLTFRKLDDRIAEFDKLMRENTDETKTIIFITARLKLIDQRREMAQHLGQTVV